MMESALDYEDLCKTMHNGIDNVLESLGTMFMGNEEETP